MTDYRLQITDLCIERIVHRVLCIVHRVLCIVHRVLCIVNCASLIEGFVYYAMNEFFISLILRSFMAR